MTDYPSDAPLPTVVIDSVKGRLSSSDTSGYPVVLDIMAHISNYQQIQDRFGVELSQLVGFTSLTIDGEFLVGSLWFQNGHNIESYQRAPLSYLGKTVTLATTQIDIESISGSGRMLYDVSPPLEFCSVSFPSSLTPNVWTDLQFTVLPPIPEVSWIVLALCIGLVVGIGVYGFWRYRK